METAGDTVQVPRAALNEIEERALSINAKIHGLMRALRAGQVDHALSVAGILQELNNKQRHAAIAAGAINSVGEVSAVWDDDEEPIDVDSLNLGELSREFGTSAQE